MLPILLLLADGPAVVPQAVAALEHLKPKSAAGPTAWTAGPYQYDPAGNIIGIGSEAFVYDKVGRVKSATVRGPDLSSLQTQTYSHDVYGNVTSASKLGQTVTLAVTPGSNRLSAASYDASGNLTASGTMHYGYDAAGMLNTIRLGDGLQPRIIYAYTADDERLFAFDVATGTTHWTLRGFDSKVLRDFKQAGSTWSVERDYVYRDGLLLAALRPGGAVEHYSLDHLGTPRVVTDGAGHKIGSHAYWPFGEEWTPGDAQEGAPLKFTGHERDADPSGGAAPLDYMHARYYGPAWGRFLSVDPSGNDSTADPQKWNRYAYARGNPLKFTDADGRKERIFVDNRTTGPTRAGLNMQPVVIQMRAKYVAARVDVSVEQGNPQVREIARAHLDGDHVRVIRLVDQPSPTDTPLATRAIGHAGAGMPPEVHVNRVAPDNPATPRDERATAVANAATHEVGHQQGLEHNDNSAQDVMKGSPAPGTLTTPRQFNATDAQILRELPPP